MTPELEAQLTRELKAELVALAGDFLPCRLQLPAWFDDAWRAEVLTDEVLERTGELLFLPACWTPDPAGPSLIGSPRSEALVALAGAVVSALSHLHARAPVTEARRESEPAQTSSTVPEPVAETSDELEPAQAPPTIPELAAQLLSCLARSTPVRRAWDESDANRQLRDWLRAQLLSPDTADTAAPLMPLVSPARRLRLPEGLSDTYWAQVRQHPIWDEVDLLPDASEEPEQPDQASPTPPAELLRALWELVIPGPSGPPADAAPDETEAETEDPDQEVADTTSLDDADHLIHWFKTLITPPEDNVEDDDTDSGESSPLLSGLRVPLWRDNEVHWAVPTELQSSFLKVFLNGATTIPRGEVLAPLAADLGRAFPHQVVFCHSELPALTGWPDGAETLNRDRVISWLAGPAVPDFAETSAAVQPLQRLLLRWLHEWGNSALSPERQRAARRILLRNSSLADERTPMLPQSPENKGHDAGLASLAEQIHGLLDEDIQRTYPPETLTSLGFNPISPDTVATFLCSDNALDDNTLIALPAPSTDDAKAALLTALSTYDTTEDRRFFRRMALHQRCGPTETSYQPLPANAWIVPADVGATGLPDAMDGHPLIRGSECEATRALQERYSAGPVDIEDLVRRLLQDGSPFRGSLPALERAQRLMDLWGLLDEPSEDLHDLLSSTPWVLLEDGEDGETLVEPRQLYDFGAHHEYLRGAFPDRVRRRIHEALREREDAEDWICVFTEDAACAIECLVETGWEQEGLGPLAAAGADRLHQALVATPLQVASPVLELFRHFRATPALRPAENALVEALGQQDPDRALVKAAFEHVARSLPETAGPADAGVALLCALWDLYMDDAIVTPQRRVEFVESCAGEAQYAPDRVLRYAPLDPTCPTSRARYRAFPGHMLARQTRATLDEHAWLVPSAVRGDPGPATATWWTEAVDGDRVYVQQHPEGTVAQRQNQAVTPRNDYGPLLDAIMERVDVPVTRARGVLYCLEHDRALEPPSGSWVPTALESSAQGSCLPHASLYDLGPLHASLASSFPAIQRPLEPAILEAWPESDSRLELPRIGVRAIDSALWPLILDRIATDGWGLGFEGEGQSSFPDNPGAMARVMGAIAPSPSTPSAAPPALASLSLLYAIESLQGGTDMQQAAAQVGQSLFSALRGREMPPTVRDSLFEDSLDRLLTSYLPAARLEADTRQCLAQVVRALLPSYGEGEAVSDWGPVRRLSDRVNTPPFDGTPPQGESAEVNPAHLAEQAMAAMLRRRRDAYKKEPEALTDVLLPTRYNSRKPWQRAQHLTYSTSTTQLKWHRLLSESCGEALGLDPQDFVVTESDDTSSVATNLHDYLRHGGFLHDIEVRTCAGLLAAACGDLTLAATLLDFQEDQLRHLLLGPMGSSSSEINEEYREQYAEAISQIDNRLNYAPCEPLMFSSFVPEDDTLFSHLAHLGHTAEQRENLRQLMECCNAPGTPDLVRREALRQVRQVLRSIIERYDERYDAMQSLTQPCDIHQLHVTGWITLTRTGPLEQCEDSEQKSLLANEPSHEDAVIALVPHERFSSPGLNIHTRIKLLNDTFARIVETCKSEHARDRLNKLNSSIKDGPEKQLQRFVEDLKTTNSWVGTSIALIEETLLAANRQNEEPDWDKIFEQVNQNNHLLADEYRSRIESLGYSMESTLFELLQNADDATWELGELGHDIRNAAVHVILREDPLATNIDGPRPMVIEFVHWGRPLCDVHITGSNPDFENLERKRGRWRWDLQSMLLWNQSTKRPDPESERTEIGYFGLGFKTVFLLSRRPVILSGRMPPFAIIGGRWPMVLEEEAATGVTELRESLSDNRMSNIQPTFFRLPLRTELSDDEHNSIVEHFRRLSALAVFFCQGVREIHIQNHSGHGSGLINTQYTRPDPPDSTEGVFLSQDRRWLIAGRNPQARIVFRLSEDGSSVETPSADVPRIWVLAPTKADAGQLPFIINARFDLDTGRAGLREDSRQERAIKALDDAVSNLISWLKTRDEVFQKTWVLSLWKALYSRPHATTGSVGRFLERFFWGDRGLLRQIAGEFGVPSQHPSSPKAKLLRLTSDAGAVLIEGVLADLDQHKDENVLENLSEAVANYLEQSTDKLPPLFLAPEEDDRPATTMQGLTTRRMLSSILGENRIETVSLDGLISKESEKQPNGELSEATTALAATALDRNRGKATADLAKVKTTYTPSRKRDPAAADRLQNASNYVKTGTTGSSSPPSPKNSDLQKNSDVQEGCADPRKVLEVLDSLSSRASEESTASEESPKAKWHKKWFPWKNFDPNELRERLKKRDPIDRDAWMVLFTLGTSQLWGMWRPAAHHGFVKLLKDKGWWDSLFVLKEGEEPEVALARWPTVLNAWADSRKSTTNTYDYWMLLLPELYPAMMFTETYVELIDHLGSPKRDLNHLRLLAPREDPVYQGSGDEFDIPPLPRLRVNWLIRELVRIGYYGDYNEVEHLHPGVEHLYPLCFQNTGRLRRVLHALGCDVSIDDRNLTSAQLWQMWTNRCSKLGFKDVTLGGTFDLALLSPDMNELLEREGVEVTPCGEATPQAGDEHEDYES